MNVFYCNDNKLYPWDIKYLEKLDSCKKTLAEIGNPLTIEYKRIHIQSKQFDVLGKSEIMVVNYVRNKQTKERAMESITYYDDDAGIKDHSLLGEKTWSVGPFDASEYGNPICFHTPGYQGTTIIITTKMWEIDDPSIIIKGLNIIKSSIGMINYISPYITIANTALGITSQVITGHIYHKELCQDHTIEFRLDSDQPLFLGTYVCFPGIDDLNIIEDIGNNYFLKNSILVRKNGQFIEFPGTYYILKVSSLNSNDFGDFDFTASSADLLKLLQGTQDIKTQEALLNVNRDSYDLKLIEKVKTSYNKWENSNDPIDMKNTLALYNQLNLSNMKSWFDNCFPEIGEKMKNK